MRALLGDADAGRAAVLGYAETATGLGHAVADGIGLAPYLHSTRRAVPGVPSVGGFEEEHSHATSHLLLPEDPDFFSGDGPLVLVDDEFSTGRTVLNTIGALHGRFPRSRYVIVALVDMRGAGDRARLTEFARELGGRGWRWSRWRPARCPCRTGCWSGGSSWWLRRRRRLRVRLCPPSCGTIAHKRSGLSSAGRSGCPTVAGTASRRSTGRGWRRRFRAWPSNSPGLWAIVPLGRDGWAQPDPQTTTPPSHPAASSSSAPKS
ncbi:hypothetical protein GCM10020000_56790 [Streptomyces olivoverticillatus]